MPATTRSALPALLLRRLDALEAHIGAALEGNVTGVHQARVASRRLREAIPIVARDVAKKERRRAARGARRLTRALGPVRELDVALALLADLAEQHPDLVVALERVRGRVEAERASRRTSMLGELGGEAVADLAARVRHLAGAHADDGASFAALGTRIARRAGGLRAAITNAGVLYDSTRLHEVRIAAKQLRYALEIAGEARAAAVASSLARLKRVQDILGDLHDRVVVAGLVVEAQDLEAEADVRVALGRLRETLETDCRVGHARYLRRRPGLLAVVIDAEDRAATRVMQKAAAARASRTRAASGARRPAARVAKEGKPC